MQVSNSGITNPTFWQATKHIWKSEGMFGFYRGMAIGTVKAGIAQGIYFGTLWEMKKSLSHDGKSDKRVNFEASVLARFTQCVLTNPFYVIKTWFEVIGFNEYWSVFDAVKKVYLREGVGGYFTGLKAALLRDVPFAGLYYPIYVECKKVFDITGSLLVSAAAAAMTANVLSCLVTHPIDIIRTRLLF